MSRSILGARFRAATVAGLAALCCACEGGTNPGGDDDPGDPGDQTAPLAAIQFPPNGCLTDAAQVHVVIAATDDTQVTGVRIGATAAVLDPLDSLWKIVVPLRDGINAITAEARDAAGNVNAQVAQVTVRRERSIWVETAGIAFDSLVDEALVLDPVLRALFGVDPVTGLRTPRSGPDVGAGTLWSDARDVEFSANLHAALVTDGLLDAVFRVDLGTGARTILSSPGVGGGPPPLDLHGIAADEVRNRMLVVDALRAEVMAVDLSTGERSTISSDSVGTGPSLTGARRIALDLARNRVLVTTVATLSILSVDLTSGNRAILSGGASGAGPAFVMPFDLVVDTVRDRALVVDPPGQAIFEVDLDTGDRRILSALGTGSGPAWIRPAGIALHLGGAPLAVDAGMDALVEVGALSGSRQIVSAITQGLGQQFSRPAALETTFANPPHFLVADPSALLATGVAGLGRAVVSDSTHGSGGAFVDLASVVHSPSVIFTPPCTAVLDAGALAVLHVDPSLGDRRVISDAVVGGGPLLTAPRRMVLERPRSALGCATTVLVVNDPLTEPAALLRIDLTSGSRTIVSDSTIGLGPILVDPLALTVDPDLGVAYVLDVQATTIFSVDLVSGDRAPVFFFGSLLAEPSDIALAPRSGQLLIIDAGLRSLRLADLVSQSLDTLSDAFTGFGPVFGRPVAFELVPSETAGTVPRTPIAYVADAVHGSIFAVDLESGDRLILEK